MLSRAARLAAAALTVALVVPAQGAVGGAVAGQAQGAVLDQPSPVDQSGSAKAAAVYPYANTFKLHSRKGSKRTIFLDFDGNTVAERSWSADLLGITPKAYPGFNLKDPSTFTEAEQDFIHQVWRRVAEAYSPFDVDVTTQDPGTDAISRTSEADDVYGVQVAITSDPNLDEVACGRGSRCSGIAPMGTFDNVEVTPSQHQPAWVFVANNYADVKNVNSASLTAQSVAHEVGHTFGLDHDGGPAEPKDYYSGHANWFPIMGRTVGRTAIGQWSKGEYAGATTTEDDLAIIAGGGAPLRADDYPNATQAPFDLGTPARSGTNAFARRGVISTDADNDHFTFRRGCKGPLLVKATGIGLGATLDLKLTVTNSAGKVLATDNPASGQVQVAPDPFWRATGLDAAVTFTKAANTSFRVRVEGVGRGSSPSTGYSGYGSLGQYTLTVSRCSTPLPAATKPGKPVIGKATSGRAGKPVNAVARWSPPTKDGRATITRYRLQATKVNARGKALRTYTFTVAASSTAITVSLPAGRYKFRVAAQNRIGAGGYSAYSKVVSAR